MSKPSHQPRMSPEDYLKLNSDQLRKKEPLSALMDCIIEIEISDEKFHHAGVRKGIIRRWRAACRLRADSILFKLWCNDPRILGLPRPPKSPEDALVAFFRATYPDPRKASKYFKRIEHLWKRKESTARDVLTFLKQYGLEGPAPGIERPSPGESPAGGDTTTLGRHTRDKDNVDDRVTDDSVDDHRSTPKNGKTDAPDGTTAVISGLPASRSPALGTKVLISAVITARHGHTASISIKSIEKLK